MCPLLILYVNFLASELEFNDQADGPLMYAKGMIGTAANFYILVMFNEAWVLNLIVFLLSVAACLVRASSHLGTDEIDIHWLCLIVLFQVFTFASVAYRTEKLAKMSFIGRESYEKSFSRWLKIFDTFPEGMAILKDDGTIMYSNDSLARLLDCEVLPKTATNSYSQVGVKTDFAGQTKQMLESVRIKKYDYDFDYDDAAQSYSERFNKPATKD